MGENPMLSDPTLSRVRETLEGLELLVVSDIFLSETARMAHVVLPAACFAEKRGTVTNSERRVQYTDQVLEPPGEAREDLWIVQELARRLGAGWPRQDAAEVMEEIALTTPIYGGMYHDRLRGNLQGLQWPCPDRRHPGTPFLHKYNFTRGSGRFEPERHVPPAELPDERYPFVFITGRRYHQYHTGTMSRRTALLDRERSRPLVEMHPEDAARLGLRDGCRVRVRSRRGEAVYVLQVSDMVRPGELCADFHFREAPTNRLTLSDWDPVAKCPEFKRCAVAVEAAHG